MQNALESRLQQLLARVPPAPRAVEERALATALAALPLVEARRRRSSLRTFVLAAGVAVLLLALSAGALAAAGALHVSLGGSNARLRQVTAPRLIVPRGARGIAAVVDGRLWFTSRSGLRIEGLPVESAALSPHAMYVAAGIGDSLVVMAPNGTRAWSHPAGGRVVAIAWAPSGLRIAYVVRHAGGGTQLRTIEGDGDHDGLLDAAVRPVTPTWRADALAVAYVGAGGRPVVYDFARRAHHVVADVPASTTRLAYAPRGHALAIGSAGGLWLAGLGLAGLGRVSTSSADSIAGIAWAGDEIAVGFNRRAGAAAGPAAVQVFRLASNHTLIPGSRVTVSGRITALDAGGGRLVLAVRRHGLQTRLVASAARDRSARQVLLNVAAGSTVGALAVR